MPQKYRIHSFRGLLANGGEDKINLERSNVTLAYRIVKFSILPNAPYVASDEFVVKAYKEDQSSIDGVVDFTDVDLIAAAVWANSDTSQRGHDAIVFTNELFSRNLYITSTAVAGGNSCNYYIEIEEVPVNSATLMQLKLGVARKLSLQQD